MEQAKEIEHCKNLGNILLILKCTFGKTETHTLISLLAISVEEESIK
jgi:hypothetical protein